MPIGLIDTATAAKTKKCSRNAILDAIKRGAIDGQQTGRYFVVMANKKFEMWAPNPNMQKSGYSRWGRKTKKAKKAKGSK